MATQNDNGQSIPATDPSLQQQQSPVQPQSAVGAAVAQTSVGGDSLTCQWQSCGERCATAEQLYDHVCERHVGRKSTNNLNLTCQWGNCRTTTVKRDHITSHIRVHVPLKPHKCDFCGKAFKRPQDLKKHVKTHADDSVLLRSPEPNRGGHGGGGPAYQNQGTKFADLQSLAATASGYYPDHHQVAGQPMYYSNAGGNSAGYHGASAPQQGSAYGPVYYAVSQTPSEKAEYELRKRAAFDALNEFFGDAKRRSIDPATYYDVGQRLSSLQTLQLPMPGGFSSGGGGDFHSGGSTVASSQGTLLQPQYSLPLSNLRTKNDLLQIDQFLDQLQQTVYENSNQAAAAGVAQPGAHYVPANVSYRSSNSPPQMSAASNPSSSHATAVAAINSTSAETPALTPASSVISYHSAHSPSSVHSGQHTERSSVPSVYPVLPTVSAMSESNVYATTSSVPPSGLATAFDGDGRRQHPNNYLQTAASHGNGDSEETPSPITSRPGSNTGARSPSFKNVDPALRSPGAQSEDSDAYKSSEAWIDNVRIIEALRQFIKEKIESGDYDEEDNESHGDPMETDHDKDAQSLYPVLREVQGEV